MTRRPLSCRLSASEAGGVIWYPLALERDAQQRPPDAQDKAHQVTDVASLVARSAGGRLGWARSETKPAHPVAGAWSGRQGEARPQASLCPSSFPFATLTTSWYELVSWRESGGAPGCRCSRSLSCAPTGIAARHAPCAQHRAFQSGALPVVHARQGPGEQPSGCPPETLANSDRVLAVPPQWITLLTCIPAAGGEHDHLLAGAQGSGAVGLHERPRPQPFFRPHVRCGHGVRPCHAAAQTPPWLIKKCARSVPVPVQDYRGPPEPDVPKLHGGAEGPARCARGWAAKIDLMRELWRSQLANPFQIVAQRSCLLRRGWRLASRPSRPSLSSFGSRCPSASVSSPCQLQR